MIPYLKIKVKSLAAEARIIRLEERKWWGGSEIRTGLHEHRIHSVRPECRHAHLAYGFLKAQSYLAMEKTCRIRPDWSRVERMVLKYGQGDQRDLKQRFEEWSQAHREQ